MSMISVDRSDLGPRPSSEPSGCRRSAQATVPLRRRSWPPPGQATGRRVRSGAGRLRRRGWPGPPSARRGRDGPELRSGQPGVDRNRDGSGTVDGGIGDEPGERFLGGDGDDHPVPRSEAAPDEPPGQPVRPGVPGGEGQVAPVGEVVPGDSRGVPARHGADLIGFRARSGHDDPVQYGSHPSRMRRGLSTIIVEMSASLIPERSISGRTSSGMWVHRHSFHAAAMEGGNQSTWHMASWDRTMRSAWPRWQSTLTASMRSANEKVPMPKWSKPTYEPLAMIDLVVPGVECPARVADDHLAEVDALLGQDPLLLEPPRLGRGGRVGGDRRPGLPVRLGHRPQHPLDTRGDSGPVGRALEDAGPNPGIADALTDLPDEQLGHRLRTAEDGARSPEMEEHRHVVVRIDAGGGDDVDVGDQLGHGDDAGDEASEADDGQVDDGVDPPVLQLPQTLHGDGLRTLLVPFRRRLLDFGAEHEDVLVHEGRSEVAPLDRPPHRIDAGHPLGPLLRHGPG